MSCRVGAPRALVVAPAEAALRDEPVAPLEPALLPVARVEPLVWPVEAGALPVDPAEL